MTSRFKPYPAYKGSGLAWPEVIPADWQINRLKFASCIEAGQSPPSDLVTDGTEGLPFLQGNADFGPLNPTPRQVCNAAPKRSRKGDILLSVRAPVGAMNISDQAYGIGRGLCAIRPPQALDLRFLYYLLTATRSRLDSVATGSTYDAVTTSDVGDLPVVLPPRQEGQRRIAAFLDRETARIDSLVEKNERLIELLQEERTALITRAVTKGLDRQARMEDSGAEWLGEIPAHWGKAFLDKLADQTRRITYGIVQPGEPDPDGILMVRGQNYSHGWSRPEEIFRVSRAIEAPYRRSRLRRGDIVMTIVGAGTGNIAVVPEWLHGANLTQTTARIALDPRKALNTYFAYQLKSVVGTVNVELTMKGAAQPGLNLGHVAKYEMVVPPLTEQRAIADFLDRQTAAFGALMACIGSAIDRLKELRTALISAAVTGKIDVRDEVA